jgi:hypothetical protein
MSALPPKYASTKVYQNNLEKDRRIEQRRSKRQAFREAQRGRVAIRDATRAARTQLMSQMRGEGHSFAAIGRACGVSPQYVHQMLKRAVS